MGRASIPGTRIIVSLVVAAGAAGCCAPMTRGKREGASFRGLATQPVLARQRSAELELARELFYRAVDGDRAALARSQQILLTLGGKTSTDPEVIAYTGAAELLQARDSFWPLQKALLATEGLSLEDRAVETAPDDLEIRFLRGATEYALPRFLGKYDRAATDLAYVARFAEHQASQGRLDPRAAAADLNYHAQILAEHQDDAGAIAAWRAAVRVDRNSAGGSAALKHLADHHAAP